MGWLRLVKAFDCFSLSFPSNSCLCVSSVEPEDEHERATLIQKRVDGLLKLENHVQKNKTLAFHLEPKTVALRVSMHCNGCARKVEKHIKKIEGVYSIVMNLESKKVVVTGDITPFQLLESVSKVKFAELWVEP
ncbi:protein SODIUM POTASSIUM ROOT DEFECTIVE 2-like [Phalaenopsis equestris]|uniref:protein SODIUM POTASSIUM ROOT DEFECTIVE 2-like n=1 Tax=Phalaenopsis equestris TaxID=78828 RepID=UPI0009E31C38|nr:protein SODIUM POTASSIUM ROOT DEFECTIVE 2-like [Phalaenopsis equestris]